MASETLSVQQRRAILLQLYRCAINAVAGDKVVESFLQQHTMTMPCSLVAIGKAAATMARGAQQALGEQLKRGLAITKQGHSEPRLLAGRITQMESAHPLPDATSLAAGRALIEFIESLPVDEPLLFLLSGGASALVEVLPAEVSAEELAQLNRWLLASGLSISEMNAIRKQLSCIKGGKLIPYLNGRHCLQLLISDVPGDDMGVIGSAPLLYSALPVSVEVSVLPEWLQQLLAAQPTTSKETAFSIDSHLVATNDMACEAVVRKAQELGIRVYNHSGHFQGDVASLAKQFCETVKQGPAGIYLWGGESSVVLPNTPGRGGRSQHLALLAAQQIAGENTMLFLAAGTDGTDGPTDDAGALVDGGTIARGELEERSARVALQQADAGSFLEASGDLIQTGPSGTNVMDLVIAWKW